MNISTKIADNMLRKLGLLMEQIEKKHPIVVIKQKKQGFSKSQLIESIIKLIDKKEEEYYNKNLLNKDCPLTLYSMKKFRKSLYYEILLHQHNKELLNCMWAIPNDDSVEIKHGWPLRAIKKKKDVGDEGSEVIEGEEETNPDAPHDTNVPMKTTKHGEKTLVMPQADLEKDPMIHIPMTKGMRYSSPMFNKNAKNEAKFDTTNPFEPRKTSPPETAFDYLKDKLTTPKQKINIKGTKSASEKVPIKHDDEEEIDETDDFTPVDQPDYGSDSGIWKGQHLNKIKDQEKQKEKQQKSFLDKLADKELSKDAPDYTIEETDQPTPRMSGVPNEPDFAGGEMVEDEEDTSDLLDPTKQHSGVMKAVNVEESEMVKRFKRNAHIKETEEEKPSMQQTIKYINKVANSDEPEKLITPGVVVKTEPGDFSGPGGRPPKKLSIPSMKAKVRLANKEKEAGNYEIEEEDEKEPEKQRKHDWVLSKRHDSRNDRIQRGRDVLGNEENQRDGKLEEKLLKLKRTYDIRAKVLELRNERLENEGFEGAQGGFGQQNVQGSFAQTPNYSSQSPDKFGTIQSPNVENSGSLDGQDHEQNVPIGDEQDKYPMYEDGAVKEKHDGRRITLGRIVQGTGFSKRSK